MLSVEAVNHHLRYNEWAITRLLEAAGSLDEQSLVRDFGTADKSILGTLKHLFHSERIWLARMLPPGDGPEPLERNQGLAELRNLWPTQHKEWQRWAEKS